MSKQLKPLPKNQSQIVQEAMDPTYTKISKPISETVFTKNRAQEVSVKDKQYKDFSISLEDHDDVIKYYFENTLKPTVIQNGNRIQVPVIYGSPERWKSVQADGYLRDKDGKLMAPFIMFKRDTLEKNRSLGNKLDGNKVHNYQIFEQRFNKKNIYDKFEVLTNRQPSKEYLLSVIPDYVTITYSCVVFTDYIEQINPIIESINFASDSYWGDFSRFKFRARIDQFTTTNEVTAEDGRIARASFNIVLNGYIIPNTINKQIASSKLYYDTAQLVFNFETTTSDLEQSTITSKPMSKNGSTTIFEGGTNINLNINGASALDTSYLSISVSKTATSVPSSNTAIFSASFAQPGSGSQLPPTTKNNFVFYINGIYVPIDYVITFADGGNGTCTLVLNTTGLGYSISLADEITAIGKFI